MSALLLLGIVPGSADIAGVAFRRRLPVTVAVGPVAVICVPLDSALHGELEAPEAHGTTLVDLALDHAETVSALAAAAGAVLPCRFGVAVGDGNALAALLAAQATTLAARLDSVSGRQEWTVRLARDGGAVEAAVLAADPDLAARRAGGPGGGEGRGAAYLKAKAADAALRRAVEAADAAAVAALHGALEPEPWVAEPVAADGPLARASWLLPEGVEPGDRLADVTATLRPRGYRLAVTGPFPPYSFARFRLDEVADV